MRTAIYLRISRDPYESRAGVRRQEEDCRTWAERQNADVVGVYCDNDTSAYSGKRRPEYTRMCDDIEAGAIDGIVVWHLDRLHRSPIELEHFIALVERNEVQVVTVTGGDYDLSTSDGRAMARVIGAFARKESEDKSRRIRRQRLQAAQRGLVYFGGHRPYGHTATRKQLVPEEARVIREMARRVLRGESTTSVARRLNERGVPTAQGALWRETTVRDILRSARLSGQVEYKGEIVARGDWPRILSTAQTDQLRTILGKSRNRHTGLGPPTRYILSELLTCGICGSTLHSHSAAQASRRYNCAPFSHRPSSCGRISIQAELTEALVSKAVLHRVSLDIRRRWPSLDSTAKQRVVANCVESITIEPTRRPGVFDPGRVVIVWQGPR